MRKRAAQKSKDLNAAAELLQHSDKRLTERHYGGVRKLKPETEKCSAFAPPHRRKSSSQMRNKSPTNPHKS